MATTKSKQSRHAPAKAAQGPEASVENPRTARSKERLAEAIELIRAELGIVHRRVRGDQGVRYEWKLPVPES